MSALRLLAIAGKGGVGKTTVAAATALAADTAGRRCLVASLDRAHSLGDVLGQALTPVPTRVAGTRDLWAAELDPQAELRENWASLGGYLGRLLAYFGVGGAIADEMAVLPGLEELLVLARLAEELEDDRYDLVVADFAPTASSLRYLSFPDLMAGALGKWVEWDRKLAHLLRPLAGRYVRAPMPEESVYESLDMLASRLGRLRDLLADPSQSAVRLVMTPETVVLDETRRAYTYLSLFGLGVDSIVANRVLPAGADLGYLQPWAGVQAEVLARARESFADLPILTLPYQPTEIRGLEALGELGHTLYQDGDPTGFSVQSPLRFEEAGRKTTLLLRLPHAPEGALDLRRSEGELILTVGGWRRRITLPDFLARRPVVGAVLSGGHLRITFATEGGAMGGGSGGGSTADLGSGVGSRSSSRLSSGKETGS